MAVPVCSLGHGRKPAAEGRIEFVIIAGDLFTLGDIADRETFFEAGEIGVRCFVVVHEPAVVCFQDPNAGFAHMRIRILRDEVLHMRREFFDVGLGEEHIEFRFETPDNIAGFDRLSSEDAYSLDRAAREKGADKHHDWLDPNVCEVDSASFEAWRLMPDFALTAFCAAPAAKEAVLSHMCFFNILQLGNCARAGYIIQHRFGMIAQL